MDSLFVSIIFYMASLVSRTSACPIQCVCSFHQVDCYGRNLQEIPPNISNSTYYLDLQENAIPMIQPERLSRLINLDDLLLRRNKLTKLDSGAFVNLTTLKRLVLSGNEIETIQPDTFVNLPSLQVLDLSSNSISNITGMFVNIPSVERLVLSLNQITELNKDSLEGLDKLQYLILSQNQISSISSTAFSKLNILSYLVLRGNPISQADRIWDGLKVLSFLDLSSCQLFAVPNGLPYTLSVLRLGNNSIQTIKSADFRSLKYLSVIYLENNLIANVQQGAFSYSPHLSQLVISGNKLTQLPGTLPAQIELLIADNNNIKHIFKTNFDHNSAMKGISLKNNSISDLAANTFGRLSHLTTLELDNNEIRVMLNMSFQGLHSLQKLSISSNPIREIQFRSLGGLAKLYYLVMSNLSSEDIEMKGNFLRDVPFLTTLDLHKSPSLVDNILNKPDMLWTLSTVKYLNLMDNNLTHLSTDLMMAMPKLRWIKATNNPWRCDHKLLPLRTWMGKSYRTFSSSSQMKCASPPILEGKSILDIPLKGFTMPTTQKMTTTTMTNRKSSSTTPTTTESKQPTDYTTKKTKKMSSNQPKTTTKTVNTATTGKTTRSSIPTSSTADKKSTQTGKVTPGFTTTNRQSEKSTDFSSTTTGRIVTTLSTSTKKPATPTKTYSVYSSMKTSTPPISIPAYETSSHASKESVVTPQVLFTTKSGSTISQSLTTLFTTTPKINPTPTTSLATTSNDGESSSKLMTDSLASSTPSSSTRSRPDKPTSLSSSKLITQSSTSATTAPSSPAARPTGTSVSQLTGPTDPNNQGGVDGRQQGEHRHLPSLTSSDQSNDNKGLIIGLVAGFLSLAVLLVIVIFMVRYQKRKKEAFFIDHDISFATNKEETSDTVCIINYLHANEHSQKGTTQDEVNKSEDCKHTNTKGSKEKASQETSGKANNTNNRQSPANGSRKHSPYHHDDTELLMDSW